MRNIHSRLLGVIVLVFFSITLTSCFTGIEGTKKIELSRTDKKVVETTEEERFLENITGIPAKDWKNGKKFLVTDERASVIYRPAEGYGETSGDSIKGKTIAFSHIYSKTAPDGSRTAVVVFTQGNRSLEYLTPYTPENAPERISSDNLPMLIDLDIVSAVDNKLRRSKLWTRSPLWYDTHGNRVNGQKFVPVTVISVMEGDMVFPLLVEFEDAGGNHHYMRMNFGHKGKDSRSFDTLFSLSDPKLRYPAIDNDVWKLIQSGKVRKGMTKEECRLSMGSPVDVAAGHDWSQTLDLWKYSDGKYLMFSDGILTDFRL